MSIGVVASGLKIAVDLAVPSRSGLPGHVRIGHQACQMLPCQNAEARGRARSTPPSRVFATPKYQHHLSPTISRMRRTASISPIMVADAVFSPPAVSHYLRYVATTGK